jgi:hypothetical protein
LKLPLLITQFLYQNKKVNLPGIGSFTMDPNIIIPEDVEKNPHEIVQGIEYNNAPVYKADDDLIEFIKHHTGKMKSLAEADLESYLTLGIQLLNIGKPFYFEGIGAIIKSQEGKYEFTPGEYVSIQKEDQAEIEKKEKAEKRKAVFEEKHDDYQPQSNSSGRFLVFAGVIIGLALIGWGGYTLYKKNTYQETIPIVNPITPDTVATKTDTLITDTNVANVAKKDSLQSPKPVAVINTFSGDSAKYKYVILETENKYRALKRYNQLLSFSLKIKMETKDSSFFKLYFTFPARIKDTLRIKDSLSNEYGTKTIIER